ncbi:hypothetical protein HPB49_012868 [Dermacentor silvarum]|uniref:Uncharacterized protein n=1 Tax=Dermacentor silvarum TaxID=543639 RepID=A0ACB8CRA5_DERSI|nr:hypothetical protein HPB49_012868 [Dermacentor silvarum]
MSLAESIAAKMACHTHSKGQEEVGTQCSLPLADKSVGCSFKAASKSMSVQTTETVDQSSSTSGLTNGMSLAESITAKMACHALSKVIGQKEVGTQYSLPLAAKSVGCSFKAASKSTSVQTTETVDQSSSTSGLTNGMSLAESITAKMACHALSKVIGQKEVGTQYSLPLADKSVGCSFKAASKSTSVQTIETVDQSSSTSASRSSNFASTAIGDNPQQGCLHEDHLCDCKGDKLVPVDAHARVHASEHLFKCHLCPQSFSRRDTLKRHLGVHTASRSSNFASTAIGDNPQQGCLHEDHLCDCKGDKLVPVDAHARHRGPLILHQQPSVTIHSRDASMKIISVTARAINWFLSMHMPGSMLQNICLSAICALGASQEETP